MRRLFGLVIALGALGLGAGWALTRPAPLDGGFAAGHTPDPQAGEQVFHAAGCASCHVSPDAETGDAPPLLSGGQAFVTDFGRFHAPNISPHPEAGIGRWTLPEFGRAVTQGVSPGGAHYYPAFPYAAYVNMDPADVADLFAYMSTLPASDRANRPHDLGFPFSIRRAAGLWKLLYLEPGFTVTGDLPPEAVRGRYLAEALAHCGECHTPRGALGGLDRGRWLAGAPNPSGKGRIPGITPATLDWSQADLVAYFTTGLTPEYDSAGGEMAAVVRNLARLPEADRVALAAYLAAVPPIE